jgi:hypothetical protein
MYSMLWNVSQPFPFIEKVSMYTLSESETSTFGAVACSSFAVW